jgi:hypothetical protein
MPRSSNASPTYELPAGQHEYGRPHHDIPQPPAYESDTRKWTRHDYETRGEAGDIEDERYFARVHVRIVASHLYLRSHIPFTL